MAGGAQPMWAGSEPDRKVRGLAACTYLASSLSNTKCPSNSLKATWLVVLCPLHYQIQRLHARQGRQTEA